MGGKKGVGVKLEAEKQVTGRSNKKGKRSRRQDKIFQLGW